MRICVNGIYRDMTKEEEELFLKAEEPIQELTLEERVAELERINEEQYQTIQELSSLMKSSLLKKEGE